MENRGLGTYLLNSPYHPPKHSVFFKTLEIRYSKDMKTCLITDARSCRENENERQFAGQRVRVL